MMDGRRYTLKKPDRANRFEGLPTGCNANTPHKFDHFESCQIRILRRETMKVKINEDWLATFIAFALLILAMVNVINPAWVKF
jgi:hypothetical protein